MVIPVPDTGKPAAIGYATRSGIPFGEGLIKNRYVGRTFIDPDDDLRQLGIRMKFNPLTSAIRGKRLVVVDDSIVRGNTTRQLVRMLFDAGAAEVHLRISSPPIVYPCFYGIDMADQDEFIAFNKSAGPDRRGTRAPPRSPTSPLTGLLRATRVSPDSFCTACFSGSYPCEVPEELRLSKFRYEDGTRRSRKAEGAGLAPPGISSACTGTPSCLRAGVIGTEVRHGLERRDALGLGAAVAGPAGRGRAGRRRHRAFDPHLVRGPGQKPSFKPAQLVVRPGLDGAVPADGRGFVAGVAPGAQRQGRGAGPDALRHPAGPQPGLVLHLLRRP